MASDEKLILTALKDCIRVNTSTRTVEIFNEHGVKHVLRDLDDETYEAFKGKFPNF